MFRFWTMLNFNLQMTEWKTFTHQNEGNRGVYRTSNKFGRFRNKPPASVYSYLPRSYNRSHVLSLASHWPPRQMWLDLMSSMRLNYHRNYIDYASLVIHVYFLNQDRFVKNSQTSITILINACEGELFVFGKIKAKELFYSISNCKVYLIVVKCRAFCLQIRFRPWKMINVIPSPHGKVMNKAVLS